MSIAFLDHRPRSEAALCRLALLSLLCAPLLAGTVERGEPWARHTIDNASRGADGVRLADLDGDGLLDIATGWEEGGLVRVYRNPGTDASAKPWPAVTAGKVRSPEDAVLVDLDGDGAFDVVSACEGRERSLYVHWAPSDDPYLDSSRWTTEAFPAARDRALWMYCLPLQVDGERGVDLVCGAKGPGAEIGWLESPEDPRDVASWTWHPLRECGWVMSIASADVDGDGDEDLVISDRKGDRRGCFWLERPERERIRTRWKEHAIGSEDREVMFLATSDLDRDGILDVICAVGGKELVIHRGLSSDGRRWDTRSVPLPEDTGTAKAVAAADMDLDGRLDLVFSCEHATGRSGVLLLSPRGDIAAGGFEAREISGPRGAKFDLVELVDLDGDGDRDVLTCEEREGLGVIWYENPVR